MVCEVGSWLVLCFIIIIIISRTTRHFAGLTSMIKPIYLPPWTSRKQKFELYYPEEILSMYHNMIYVTLEPMIPHKL